MKIFKNYFLISIIIGSIAVFAVMPKTERIGDRIQIALPIAGLVCSFSLKEAGSYFARYVAGLTTVHAFKNALPDSGINLRPDGGGNGFPSGHTFSASYGASYIARQCASKVPYIGPAAVLAAGFTATSRVDAEKHNPWQVLFGALFALFFDRAFQSKASKERRKAFFAKLKN